MYYLIVATLLAGLLGAVATAEDVQIFECNVNGSTAVSGKSGILSMKAGQQLCAFKPDLANTFFALETDNLLLNKDDRIKLITLDAKDNEKYVSGPMSDLLAIGMKQLEVAFVFKEPLKVPVQLKFTTEPSITIRGDRPNEMLVRSIEVKDISFLPVARDQPLHIEVRGSSDTFGHYLYDSNTSIPIKLADSKDEQQFAIKASPVLKECSQSIKDTAEATHELAGPQDISKVGTSYRCVNLFELNMPTNKQAHYDVSFANFLDMTDNDDELLISDGSQPLRIFKSTAKAYYQQKPELSFQGQKLLVSYENPKVASKIFKSKLTIKSKTYGGLIEAYGALPLPVKGSSARYSLRPSDIDGAASLLVKDLKGADLKISNGQGHATTLTSGMFLPPEIVLQVNQDWNLEVPASKSQPSGSLAYQKSTAKCGGLLMSPPGEISVNGASTTCYWLLGAASTLSLDRVNLPQGGCLEIHLLASKDPIFSKCSISPAEVLPQFALGPAYIKISTSTANSSFVSASLSKPAGGLVASAQGVNSAGYPVAYPWTGPASGDSVQLNATGKSVVLSVKDLDLREGEKLLVDSAEVKASKIDLDISNKTVKMELQRPTAASTDFKLHRGLSLVTNQFDKILAADSKANKLVTPKNVSNLLVRVVAAPKMRLSYGLSGVPSEKSAQVLLFDSQSLLGRQVVAKEELVNMTGSGTSNTLLVWVRSTTNGTSLPEMTLTYNQIACNQTSDHMCDNNSRCIPADKMCKGKFFCQDGSDMTVPCTSGPQPPPKVIQRGLSGFAVFFLSLLMLALGSLATLYGPDMFKSLENRFRSGQYTTFSSTE